MKVLSSNAPFNAIRNFFKNAVLLIPQIKTLRDQRDGLLCEIEKLSALSHSQILPDHVCEYSNMLERILDSSISDEALGFRRGHAPVLIELNGDLMWLPADMLKFVWHCNHPSPSFVPKILAETEHYLWIKDKLSLGDTAIDAGANIGLFSNMMASRVGIAGSVHAFEPSPTTVNDLRRVMMINQRKQVVINDCAVSSTSGMRAFMNVLAEDVRRESSCLGRLERNYSYRGLGVEEVSVRTTTLDGYVAEMKLEPDLIKIDVEGAEFLVLDGALETIERFRPLLVVETHEDANGYFDHDRLIGYFSSNSYRYKKDRKIYYFEPAEKLTEGW